VAQVSDDFQTLAVALKAAIDFEQKKLNELSDREGDLFRREQAFRLREEKQRAGMKKIKDVVETYFRAPSK